MALLAAGRRLPIVRDLSALAIITRREAGTGSSWLTSALMSTSSSSSGGSASASGGADAPDAAKTPAASPDADGDKQPMATAPATVPESASSSPATRDDEGDWTEVVHASGQVYYWNQRTGETTELGQPKPGGRGSSGGGEGGGAGAGAGARAGAGGSEGSGAGGGASAGGGAGVHADPRAEAPLEDRTGTYAAVGIVVGAFLGWVSQFV